MVDFLLSRHTLAVWFKWNKQSEVQMARSLLSDQQWQRIYPLIPESKPGGRPPLPRRIIMDGVFWILRTGAPWRDLPEEFGAWQTVWRLFDQWNGDGTLDKILQTLQGEIVINTDLWCIDGSVIRAARCASGGGKKGTLMNLRTML
jgi:transposase